MTLWLTDWAISGVEADLGLRPAKLTPLQEFAALRRRLVAHD